MILLSIGCVITDQFNFLEIFRQLDLKNFKEDFFLVTESFHELVFEDFLDLAAKFQRHL